METKEIPPKRKRGRPPKDKQGYNETREALIQAGLESLTEKGFVSSSIDEVLKKVSIPKGSYYHYFPSKEEFGKELLDRYISFFADKLKRHLGNDALPPLERLESFVNSASNAVERYDFKRGCLVGNLGQEMSVIPESFRGRLKDGFKLWQDLVADCLKEAQKEGKINAGSDCHTLAEIFWTGWEGAVMRAKIDQSREPLLRFHRFFINSILHNSSPFA